ncbi:dihydropteroate synthase [bacterium]|nr:MAG: dihydropteroate synthase [bacterium]
MFVRTLSPARMRGGPLASAATARAVALDALGEELAARVAARACASGLAVLAAAGSLQLAGTLAQYDAAAAAAEGDVGTALAGAAQAVRNAMDTPARLQVGRFSLGLERALVMGILNVAKESFYDGGRYRGVDGALERAGQMLAEGADIVDVGGQSYNAVTPPVSQEEERGRVVPVVEALVRAFPGVVISVDTVRSAVARAALEAGAAIINDCSGNADPGMAAVCAAYGAGDVIVHLKGRLKVREPEQYVYGDVTAEIVRVLEERCGAALAAGVRAQSLIVDPGLEFGKEPYDDLTIVERLEEFMALGYPVLVAASRKSFMGRLFALPAAELLAPSAAVAAYSVLAGARIIRAHDIQFTVRLVKMLEAISSDRKRELVP